MKKFIISLFVVAAFFAGSTLKAQTPKIGHVNMQELIQAMPESDSAQKQLQKLAKEMDNQYQQMQVEFNKKYEEYTKNSSTYSELIKTTKEAELQDMSQRMQSFQTTAQQNLQQQNQKLLKPILEKVQKAIAEVAKENKFTYVLDTAQGVVIYQGPDAIDLMSLARKKLGLSE